MENSVLTHMLAQAHVRQILAQAERDQLASKVPTSASWGAESLVSHLARIWCSRWWRVSIVTLARETVRDDNANGYAKQQ